MSSLLLLWLMMSPPGGGAATDGIGPLPPVADIEGWTRAETFDVYRGAELYGHINGGSEVYLELGFDHLVVQRYRDGKEREVIAEHYVMDDPIAALGVYMLRCGPREFPNQGLTIRHSLIPDQLAMVEGNTFTVVVNPSGDTSMLPLVAEIGRAIERETPDTTPTTPFDSLPTESRIPLSERVIRGPFTLAQLGTLGGGDILQLVGNATGVCASYGEGDQRHTLLVVEYRDTEAAAAAFTHLTGNLDSYLEQLESSDARLVWRDYTGRFGKALVGGRRIEIWMGRQDLPEEPRH